MKIVEGHYATVVLHTTNALSKRISASRSSAISALLQNIMWIAKGSVVQPMRLNKTMWFNQRSAATKLKRSERWIHTLMSRLEKLGFIEIVGQKVYEKDKYGPTIIRLGKALKALIFAGVERALNPQRYYDRKKAHKNSGENLTSYFKRETTKESASDSSPPFQFSFIPDFKSLIKSLS